LTVSVVIPAYRCQETLDQTLASLSRQTYPADLLEVVVVDDNSAPPLTLPAARPQNTVLVRPESGWGRANALHHGATHSAGEILHWLDADMVAHPEHVAAQARWHHVLPYAVTLGYKRFVDRAPATWDTDEGEPHSYVERYIAQTDGLRTADHLAFKIHVGATAALRRELYVAAGGFDTDLRLGEDTEFGYRLAQAGAVFIPEPRARSWHLGRTHVQQAHEQVTRYNRPFLADRIPFPRHWRRAGGPTWTVPLVEVVLPVAEDPVERVRATVDALLRGTEPDLRVTLVGPWDKLDDARVPVLTDPDQDLRLMAAYYKGESRVRLAADPPSSAFPTPYLLELPAAVDLAPDAVRSLVDIADRHQAGVVRVGSADGPSILLWRTAAVSRARRVRADGDALLDTVAAVHGCREVDASAISGGRSAGLVPTLVEVEGVRSLARAAAVVAWLGVRRVLARLRRRR
jgi:GT2 family glycosyltransferase